MLSELAQNIEATKKKGHKGAVNRVLELVGKELGMFVDQRMEIRSPWRRVGRSAIGPLLQLAERFQGGIQLAASAHSTPPLVEEPRGGQ